MSDTEPRWNGRRLVLFLYVAIVAITGVLGLVLGAFLPMERSLDLFFLIPLPPTPLGFATFGVVTVGVALGIPLLLVVYLSRRTDSASVPDKET